MKEKNAVMGIFFLAGFLFGTLLPNILWKTQASQNAVASMYFLTTFVNTGLSGKDFFLEILRVRGSYLVLCVLCGFSVFGVPLAAISSLVMGLQTGGILTVSVLQFGLTGGLIGLSFLMPHYVIYIPVWLKLMEEVYKQSKGIWSKEGTIAMGVGGYCKKVTGLIFLYVLGVLAECYINPAIVEKMTNSLKIF